jgi:hypothetical protein
MRKDIEVEYFKTSGISRRGPIINMVLNSEINGLLFELLFTFAFSAIIRVTSDMP